MRKLITLIVFCLVLLKFSNAQYSVSISPNPVVGIAEITYSAVLYEELSLEMRNIVGQKVWEPFTDSVHWPGLYSFHYDMSGFDQGIYFLQLLNSTGVVAYNRLVIDNSIVSISEIQESRNYIYPNPATNWIKIPNDAKGVRVFDTRGREVLVQRNQSERIDVSGLGSGIYFVDLLGLNVSKVLLQISK